MSISMFLIMTTGKQSTMRYRILHNCLRAMRCWSIEELIEKMAEHDLPAEKRWMEKDFETQRIRSAYSGSYALRQGCRRRNSAVILNCTGSYIKNATLLLLMTLGKTRKWELLQPLSAQRLGSP
jgi:hypothetical protein